MNMAQNYTSTCLYLACSFGTILVLLQIQLHSVIGSPQSLPQFFNNEYTNTLFPFFGRNGSGPPFFSQLNPFRAYFKRRKGEPREYNKERQTPTTETKERKKENFETITELECTNTMFMGPFHDPVGFSQNSSIYTRIDKSCKWAFIGTEACIPTITCDTSHLTRGCENEYLEIVDGGPGYMKFCRGNLEQVTNISASGNLRDLWIQFKVLKGVNSNNNKRAYTLFNCTVVCSERNQGTQLAKGFKPKMNAKCLCGTKPNEDRIVGGNAAKKLEYPWIVALVETNTRQPFCGGSIINNRMIITAAHCIKGKFMDYRNIQVMVNGHEFDTSPVGFQEPRIYSLQELETIDKNNGSQRYNIDEIIIHELYLPDTNDFDVALLKVQENIEFMPTSANTKKDGFTDQKVQQPKPVCLPELGTYSRTYSNKMAIVSGWGLQEMNAGRSSRFLQKLEVKILSPQACKETYYHRVNRRMLCGGHRQSGRDACSGDSGGPLVLEEKHRVWTQIGVVSWGEGCGMTGNPGVYFRITEGNQWIHYNSNYNAWRDEDDDDQSATWCLTPS